jgi:hypothetical protein
MQKAAMVLQAATVRPVVTAEVMQADMEHLLVDTAEAMLADTEHLQAVTAEVVQADTELLQAVTAEVMQADTEHLQVDMERRPAATDINLLIL